MQCRSLPVTNFHTDKRNFPRKNWNVIYLLKIMINFHTWNKFLYPEPYNSTHISIRMGIAFIHMYYKCASNTCEKHNTKWRKNWIYFIWIFYLWACLSQTKWIEFLRSRHNTRGKRNVRERRERKNRAVTLDYTLS